MTIKIAVAGTHSTGKTTFVNTLRATIEGNGHTTAVVSDLGAEALTRGFPILHDHTPQSTLWIMTTGIARELEAALSVDVVLVDRPVPDALGYYWAALAHRNEQPPESWAGYLLALARHHAATYDLIFATVLDPEIPLGRGKPRDPDGSFRTVAAACVDDVLRRIGVVALPLTAGGHAVAVAEAMRHVTGHRNALLPQAK